MRESDYDIIVVSEKFRSIPFLRRMEDVYELWDGDESIDAIDGDSDYYPLMEPWENYVQPIAAFTYEPEKSDDK